MAVGIIGEVIELCEAEDSDNSRHVLEELGDLQFFIEGYRQALDPVWTITWQEKDVSDAGDTCNSRAHLLSAAGHLLDLTKRYTIYDKLPFNSSPAREALHAIMVYTLARGMLAGYTYADMLEHNYAKLHARYSTGTYSDQQAQDRADKT